ncbi:MAG: winged helix-turn-helix transcriptional regulator [Candidatus Heimdallarchaeota archaeon]|nr:winged helix-turn-helix transcriptional regulator [Candidatus Heimdallarchaeota archaeon]
MSEDEKPRVAYRKYNTLSPKSKLAIEQVLSIETRHAIIQVINTFGSCNIKKLAKVLNKNEATIHHHIQELLKAPKLITLDADKTQKKKGKYYKLTPLSMDFIVKDLEDVEKYQAYEASKRKILKVLEGPDEEIINIYYKMMQLNPELGKQAETEGQRIQYNHILEAIMLNNFKRSEDAIKEGKIGKNNKYPFGTLESTYLNTKIHHVRNLFEIIALILQFQADFAKLSEKFSNEIKELNVPEEELIQLHFHLVGGELTEFEFEDK